MNKKWPDKLNRVANFYGFWLLLALTYLQLFWNLGGGSLREWDEGIYACATREMYEAGDWMSLRLNGEFWIDKPPLMFWGQLCLFNITGVNEWSLRLFPALCGLLTILTVYWLLRSMTGSKLAAVTGGLILLTLPHFTRYARYGQTDVILTCFITLALYGFWMGRQKSQNFLLFGAAFGLALLSKQFLGAFVLIISGAFIFFAWEWKILKNKYVWFGLFLTLLVILPWHLQQIHEHGQRFWDVYFKSHVQGRIGLREQTKFTSPLLYATTIFEENKVWSLCFLLLLPYTIKSLRTKPRPEFLFCHLWFWIILLVFSLMQSRLPWYIIPAYPAMAALIPLTLWLNKKENLLGIFFCLSLLMVPANMLFAPSVMKRDFSPEIKALGPIIQKELSPDETLVVIRAKADDGPWTALFYGRRKVLHLHPAKGQTLEDALNDSLKNHPERKWYLVEANPQAKDIVGNNTALGTIRKENLFTLCKRKP